MAELNMELDERSYEKIFSRNGFWGKDAINAISECLDKELPGLRGFPPKENGEKQDKVNIMYEEFCVLRFTAESGRYYCDLKTESFLVEQQR